MRRTERQRLSKPGCTTMRELRPFRKDVAAVVVLYDPDTDIVTRITRYAAEVDRLIAVDNSASPRPSLAADLEGVGVDYVPLGSNRGVASALNVGCRRAIELGYAWALTMDQDSDVPAGFVASLARCIGQTGSEDVAVVAPVVQQLGSPAPAPIAGCEEVTVALTSGSLLRLSAYRGIGGFRDDLFIDQVDHEFCLRAKRSGWRILRRKDAIMMHRMGSRRLVTFPVRCRVSDYSPVRRYYMVRNTLELRREYRREFPDWVQGEYRWWSRELVKMLVFERHRLAKLRMMLAGWYDYRRRRFGRFEDIRNSEAGSRAAPLRSREADNRRDAR